jgi:hypothetical protein
MPTLRSLLAAALALTFCSTPRPASAEPAYELRARDSSAHGLIRLLAGLDRKNTVVGPGATGTVRLDVKKGSIHDLQGEVMRASGASFLVLGRNFVLIDAPGRIEAAKGHPVRPLLDADQYDARLVSFDFQQIPLLRLLRILAEVAKRPFEAAEGIDARLTVVAKNVPWTKLLDVLAVAGDLKRTPVDRSIRFARRGDRTQRFTPVEDLDGVDADDRTPRSPWANRCRSPLGGSDLGEMKLVATLTGLQDPVAVVRLPDDREYFVRRGTCIGTTGGVAARVERERVVVHDQVQDDDSREVVERVLAFDPE